MASDLQIFRAPAVTPCSSLIWWWWWKGVVLRGRCSNDRPLTFQVSVQRPGCSTSPADIVKDSRTTCGTIPDSASRTADVSWDDRVGGRSQRSNVLRLHNDDDGSQCQHTAGRCAVFAQAATVVAASAITDGPHPFDHLLCCCHRCQRCFVASLLRPPQVSWMSIITWRNFDTVLLACFSPGCRSMT